MPWKSSLLASAMAMIFALLNSLGVFDAGHPRQVAVVVGIRFLE